jgi:hypothetical protein
MSGFAEFAQRLLTEGSVVLRQRPEATPADRAEAAGLLEKFYRDYCLDVAGPPPDFAAPAALAAAEFVWRACWFLLVRDEEAEVVEQALQLLPAPAGAGQQLSADLLLRFLPQVQRRARALAADDVLTQSLERVLRRWPLSGVLSDVAEGPEALDLAGHEGLMLLYAERLAGNVKPAWVPVGGPARDWVERVFAERGLPVPKPGP